MSEIDPNYQYVIFQLLNDAKYVSVWNGQDADIDGLGDALLRLRAGDISNVFKDDVAKLVEANSAKMNQDVFDDTVNAIEDGEITRTYGIGQLSLHYNRDAKTMSILGKDGDGNIINQHAVASNEVGYELMRYGVNDKDIGDIINAIRLGANDFELSDIEPTSEQPSSSMDSQNPVHHTYISKLDPVTLENGYEGGSLPKVFASVGEGNLEGYELLKGTEIAQSEVKVSFDGPDLTKFTV